MGEARWALAARRQPHDSRYLDAHSDKAGRVYLSVPHTKDQIEMLYKRTPNSYCITAFATALALLLAVTWFTQSGHSQGQPDPVRGK
jgi:hypothetical protein